MSGTSNLDLALLKTLDEICEPFEAAWHAGETPRLEPVLQRLDEPLRTVAWKEMLLIELEWLRRRGQSVDLVSYRNRFPEYSTVLEARWFESPATVSVLMELQPDRLINQYRLRHELGRGGFGVVWLADDLQLERPVALKFLVSQPLQAGSRRTALREARLAAGLIHDGIVRVLGFGNAPPLEYIVSDYVSGQTLKEWAQLNRPEPQVIAGLCERIAIAVHYAHQNGIIHRDLKPGNIIVTADGQPRVMDFGLARRIGQQSVGTLSGQILGSTGYMSPEQAGGHAHKADARSDLYSLGVILYELLTGQLPKQQAVDTLTDDNWRPPRDPDSSHSATSETPCPKPLRAICRRALQYDPAQRYATAADFARDLQQYLHARPVQAVLDFQQQRQRERRRAYLKQAGSVSIGLCLSAALGWRNWAESYGFAKRDPLAIPVRLTTQPSDGAMLAVIPLDDVTGMARTEEIFYPYQRTPVVLDLRPGDYLIVAKLDEHRFHEVFRHVPRRGELNDNFSHHSWRGVPGDGVIDLRPITIPDQPDLSRMVLINPSQFGSSLPPFYMDAYEYSEGDSQRHFSGGNRDLRWIGRSPRHPLCVPFDHAVAAAERDGKRLPDEAEFQLVATLGGRQRYSFGAQLPVMPSANLDRCDLVGRPEFDAVRIGSGTIYGLCSNAAEWTVSCTRRTTDGVPLASSQPSYEQRNLRPVRGGGKRVVEGQFGLIDEERDPAKRYACEPRAWLPGTGFRCVRNVRPRWTAADFVSENPV